MNRIKFKEFEKTYDLKMLTKSLATYRVGFKAEYNNIFKSKFEIEQIYFTEFLELASQTEIDIQSYLDIIHADNNVQASFAAVDIERTDEIKSALKIPQIGADLSGSFNSKKILKFSYEDVSAKVLIGDAMSRIVSEVISIKKNDRKWFKKIDGIWFIQEMYYAKRVELLVEKNYSLEMKAELEKINVDFSISAAGASESKITFGNPSNCPFAVKLEKVFDLAD